MTDYIINNLFSILVYLFYILIFCLPFIAYKRNRAKYSKDIDKGISPVEAYKKELEDKEKEAHDKFFKGQGY